MAAPPPPGTYAVQVRRPAGVTVLAILQALVGVLLVLSGIGTLLAATLFAGDGMSMPPGLPFTRPQVATFLGAVGAALLVLGIVALAIAWGLWTLRPWARTVALALALLGLLTSLAGIAAALVGIAVSWGSLLTLAINLLILWYLLRPEVRAAFEARRAVLRRAA